MLKTIILFLFTGVVTTIHAQQKTTSQPNIIFILADDLGYADVGCYGQQKTETPNIDDLAKQGLKFTQFYAGSTVCAPSRNTLLTGLHTGHTSVRGNKSFLPEGQTPLDENVVTIANQLQQHGYRTAAFGKWGLGFITTSGDPAKKGFEEFFGYNCQSLAHDYYPDHLWHDHDRIDLTQNLTANVIYSADTIQAKAMQFIQQQNNSKPFFLYVPYTLPHGDVIAPHDSVYNYYVQKFNEAAVPYNPKKDKLSYEPHPHAAFAAMVYRLDKYVGEIVNAVQQQGLAENTLILFSSDNGPHRENGGDPDFFQNHGMYRGIKRDLYEGGIRVPFIAYWKGMIQPGVTDQWGALWDMYPSFEQIAGMPVTKKIDGISIVPTLLNKGKQKQHEYLYWEFHENNGRQAVRWKNWKLIKLNVNIKDSAVVELYDLDKDPSEKNNIASQFPNKVKKLDAMIKKAHSPSEEWPLLPEEVKGRKVEND